MFNIQMIIRASAEKAETRFGFNNLIQKMTASAKKFDEHLDGPVVEEPEAPRKMHQQPVQFTQRTSSSQSDDDARIEIPAFLRRQAN